MVKKTFKIVVCDDQADVENSIIQSLPKPLRAGVQRIEPDEISTQVAILQRRNAAARTGKRKAIVDAAIFDDADLFIVDYDLIDAARSDYFTGETLAYLARCYSTCGAIVALNQYHRSPTFDLTLHSGLKSFADLNLSIDELKNPGLWSDKWKGYRPWGWPVITEMARQLEGRVGQLKGVSLTTKVATFLQLPEAVAERIPTRTWELIGPKAMRATLGDIIESPLLGLKGREAADRKKNQSQDARIVAARLHAWLNLILVTQDIFIDLPHLAARCPSVMGSKSKLANFNAIAGLGNTTFAKSKVLKSVQFTKADWLDRPVWFWPEIERQRLVDEVACPWLKRPNDFVFCEDTSRFVARKDAKGYQTDLPTSFRTRFVKQVPGIEYSPLQRLAAN
jgi:hypothetical protein